MSQKDIITLSESLVSDVRSIIEEGRRTAFTTAANDIYAYRRRVA